MKLNIGCGSKPKDGYINVDIQGSLADVIADCKLLPFKNETFDIIESYHLIEHMDRNDAYYSVGHWFDLLKSYGTLVIECPDIKEVVAQYLNGNEEMLYSIYGRNRYAYDVHMWGYSNESIERLLYNVGFQKVKISGGTDYHSTFEPCLRAEAIK